MVTFNVGHVALWTLAGLGALWLVPKLVRGVLYLGAGIYFMIRGDG